MKNKKRYRLLFSWLLIVVMTIMNVLPAFAQPTVQTDKATVKTGSLIVVVKEKDSDIMLSGNGFTLSNKDTGETYTGITDDSGTCEFLDIPTGTYTLEDTDPVPDYQVMSKQTIKVEESTEKTFTVQKRKLAVTATLTIKTIDAKEEDVAIAGITFDLFDDSDTKVDTVTTTTAGSVTVDDIKPGNYYLIQKNTIGDYVLDDTPTEFSITIPEGHTSWEETVIIRLYKDSATDHEGDLGTANVTIKDKDTGAGIPDVGFTLYKAADDSVVGVYRTDDTGKLKVLYLEQDTYYFMLTEIPDGYYFDMSHKFEFELKYPVLEHTVNVTAQLQQEMTEGSIKILVTDEESKTPISDVSLTLKNSNGDIVEGSEKTTTADGTVSYENLPFGIYKMQLTSVPEEYPLNQTVYTIDLKQEKPKYTFELKLTQKANLTGTLNLTVVDQDSNKPLNGASFKLYKEDGTFVQDVAVDASGTVSVKNLPMGKYYLMENSMPEGYQINNTKKYDFRFEGLLLAANITIKKPYGTQANSGTLTVTVVDQDDNSKPVVGATLTLLKDSKEGPIFGTYKTNNSGQFTVKNIPLGTYWLSESTMPYGYTISKNKTEISFTAEKPIFNLKLQKLFTDPEGGGGSEGGGSEGGGSGEETTKKGAIHVTVVDKETQNPIQNAVIEFYQEDGSLVKEVTTGTDGKASIEELNLAKYYFTEKTMPEGYTPSLEKHRVDLTKFSVYDIKLEKLKAGGEGGGGEIPEQQKGTLTVVFKDMDTQKGIAGIKVELHKETGELVGASTTKDDGQASYTNLEFGNYYFVETVTPEDYAVNTDKRAVSVTKDVPSFTLTVNKMKKGSSGGQIGDKGKISITVVDMKTKERIKGAVLALYDAATNIKMSEETSDENGKIELNDLDLKEYYLKEQSMPEGYEVETEPKYRIPLSKEIQTYTFTLQKSKTVPVEPEKPEVLKGSYILNVVDAANETIKIEDAKFGLYKEDGTKIASYTTNANGNITISDLEYGKYYVQEESMPGRYILNLAKQPFELSKDCVTFTMTIRKAKRSSGGGSSGGGGGSSSGGGGGSHSSSGSSSGGSAKGPGISASAGGPGVSTPNFNKAPVTNGSWKQEADGRWWYQFNNSNTYPKDSWECIPSNGNNIWYYFDGEGYMKTGWIYDSNGNWRFMNQDGAMYANTWHFDGTNWFRLNEQGVMQTGWVFVDNNWFYLNPVSDGTRGAMQTGWIFVDNNWFYLNPVSDGTRGAMKTGYQVIDGKAYYFNEVSDGTRGALR